MLFTSLRVARVAFGSDPTPFRVRKPFRRRTSTRRNLTALTIQMQVSQIAILVVPHFFPPLFIFRKVNLLSLRKLTSSKSTTAEKARLPKCQRTTSWLWGKRQSSHIRRVPYLSMANNTV